jgi:two-component system phosphate regulon response regulator PhoB
MAAKVLVVEDEAPLAELLRYNLEAEGYKVDCAATGDEAECLIAEQRFDMILLDWMLPGLSGIELCRRIRNRSETKNVPVLMLTARGEEADRIRGLAVGADDYVVKPFSVPELMARTKAILRRASPALLADVLDCADIQLDRTAHRVLRSGRDIRLGPTEYRLLEFFMQAPGRVFTRSQLLDGVWGHGSFIDERTIDVHVGRLRKSLVRGRESDPIRTVRGSGYVFGERQS